MFPKSPLSVTSADLCDLGGEPFPLAFTPSTLPLLNCVPSAPTWLIPLPLRGALPIPRLSPHLPQKLLHRQRVDPILLLQPTPPRHRYPIPEEVQIPCIMRIR